MSDQTYEALYQGAYFAMEKTRYPETPILAPESQTGFLQKKLEEIHEEFEKKSFAQDSEISSLRMQIEALTLRISDLKAEFEAHRKQEFSSEIIEIRDIPLDKVKEEMLLLMSDGKTRYFDEIATELKVDVQSVVEAFQQLNAEGKLFASGDKI